jgi:diguanylate cyclase (GGDEF)-like protein
MNELAQINSVDDSVLVAIAYEYDINNDVFSWKGNVEKVFAVAGENHINSIEKYSLLIHKDDRKNYNKAFHRCISEGQPLNIAYNILLANGNIFKVDDVATIVENEGNKVIIGIINIKESKDGLSQSTEYHDNTNFLNNLSQYIKRAKLNGTTGCLLKISANNLPTFISWNGEEAVDQIMKEIKESLTKFVGSNSYVDRISIDEFGVIIEDTSKDSIHQIINKIHHHIKNYRSSELEEHYRLNASINTSIGSVFFPESAETAKEAMVKAFTALTAAKESTNDPYCDYIDAKKEQQLSKEKIEVMYYMKDAVNQDKFCLAFQPIVESRTGKAASYECLLRVKDDEGKVSTAWPIIHVAEKTGFIDVVDNFVLDKVVEELQKYKDIELCFNVSNITTDNPKWLANCTKYLSDPDIASRVTVEITETAAERDLKQTAYFVASLQALGCKVALDDFGAGYTSFRQLKSLSVDLVKIDGMFVLDLAENSENLLFIKTLLDFNNCYGLQTIAECVESGEVAKLLMDLNVDYMQGYYFGVPNIAPPWRN